MQEKPYEQGYADFFRGVLTSCYRPRSFYEKEWLRGFNAAYFINRSMYV